MHSFVRSFVLNHGYFCILAFPVVHVIVILRDCASRVLTVGIAAGAQVVQSRGIADQVKVTGLGLPSEMREFVKDGTVEGFQLWSPYNEGWLAAHFAVGLKNGSMSNEVGGTFEVPNLGTITINDGNSINTQAALTTFNAANIDDFDF